MASDYSIVVPSLNRPGNMATILSLFPNAYVTVNKSGIDQYKGIVPAKQLIPHPDMKLIETRNWILDKFDTECVIQFNDDVQKLVAIGVKNRVFRDPNLIRGVIENTIQCARDLDIGVFCWSLTSNSSMLHPTVRPFRAAAPCSAHAFGVCGRARQRRLDPAFRGCGDFDFTLRTLLDDRLLLCDVRWHFACGGMSRGRGGETGALKPEERDAAQKLIRDKWGKYVGKSKTQGVLGKSTWRAFSVNVKRVSPLGIK